MSGVARVEGNIGPWLAFLTKQVKEPVKLLRAAFVTRGIRDIVEHFEGERGPDGAWRKRKQSTQERYAKIGSGQWKTPTGIATAAFDPSNKLLQMTGNLRKSILPASLKKQIEEKSRTALFVFSPIGYSGVHDEGSEKQGIAPRPFMWLSDKAQEDMAGIIVGALAEGMA